ncbi:MAG TPA: 16S rRNA (adenine(1518)-N(6)/adenine(1519)-N(6))-dimethyltransferase RsmA [Pseudomonadales bacterium]|nr:16S rRNA (adenine(1518)-N(6)/adenine(1519)-N(6))-dimethyltransferase RsmA [Pseudomonadales bacterium]HNH70432.1 16S rRNA (adenine(1518)-N(6)/adenine(1519)-N(6))-dimethyltransferase RsmA [Pseudomonadales bacterium]HNV55588.1 16S rRNA (adenine(1518)-N(6)/adenine(1519)-N(6))-dimethyltransferase RsmA [Pseudomonadales bacterium]
MSNGHRPRKRFGQHFLHDRATLAQIHSSVAPTPADHLVEIGPGTGALTELFAPAARRLDLIEIDRDLVLMLQRKFAALPQLRLHQADALRFDFTRLVIDRPLRIIGNLPYNISTPLLFHLIEQAASIQDMHFLLQKEVVDRLAAAPASADYGRLSVMVQYHCLIEPLFDVPPEAFSPPPRVDSRVVRITPLRQRPVQARDERRLAEVVRVAFTQRRKKIRNALESLIDGNRLQQIGIDPALRPDQLDLRDFVAISDFLTPQDDSARDQ